MFEYRENGIVIYTSHTKLMKMYNQIKCLKIAMRLDNKRRVYDLEKTIKNNIYRFPKYKLDVDAPNAFVVDNQPLVFIHISCYVDYLCDLVNNDCEICKHRILCDLSDNHNLPSENLILMID